MSGKVIFQNGPGNILKTSSVHPYSSLDLQNVVKKFPTAMRPLSGRVACES